jgi:hypothetical protein
VEVFVDFGLFEVIAALGLSTAARRIYSHRALRLFFLAVSVGAPAALVFMVHGEATRWVAGTCLGTSLVNGTAVLTALRRGHLGREPRDQPLGRGQEVAPDRLD